MPRTLNWLDGRGLIPDFSLRRHVQTGSKVNPACNPAGAGYTFGGIMWPEPEAGYPPPTKAAIKYVLLLHAFST